MTFQGKYVKEKYKILTTIIFHFPSSGGNITGRGDGESGNFRTQFCPTPPLNYVVTPLNAWYCRDEALKYYHQMVTIRRMETAAANLYKEKEIRGNNQSSFVSALSWEIDLEVGTYKRELN